MFISYFPPLGSHLLPPLPPASLHPAMPPFDRLTSSVLRSAWLIRRNKMLNLHTLHTYAAKLARKQQKYTNQLSHSNDYISQSHQNRAEAYSSRTTCIQPTENNIPTCNRPNYCCCAQQFKQNVSTEKIQAARGLLEELKRSTPTPPPTSSGSSAAAFGGPGPAASLSDMPALVAALERLAEAYIALAMVGGAEALLLLLMLLLLLLLLSNRIWPCGGLIVFSSDVNEPRVTPGKGYAGSDISLKLSAAAKKYRTTAKRRLEIPVSPSLFRSGNNKAKTGWRFSRRPCCAHLKMTPLHSFPALICLDHCRSLLPLLNVAADRPIPPSSTTRRREALPSQRPSPKAAQPWTAACATEPRVSGRVLEAEMEAVAGAGG